MLNLVMSILHRRRAKRYWAKQPSTDMLLDSLFCEIINENPGLEDWYYESMEEKEEA